MPIMGGGGGGGGGSPSVGVAVTHLSAAEILALDTTPVTLVAAVPGKIIVPINLCGSLTYVSTTYQEAGRPRVFTGPTFSLTSWGAMLTSIGLLTAATAAIFVDLVAAIGNDQEPTASLVNQPLRLDESAAVTGGDGSLSITTLYYLATP